MSIPRKKVVNFKGCPLTLYTVGWLAKMSGAAQVTLRLWERQGLLPKPVFGVGNGVRYYSAPELRGYSTLIKDFWNKSSRNPADFKNRLHQFRMSLEAAFKRVTEENAKKLPNHTRALKDEDGVLAMFKKKKQDDLDAQVRRILWQE